MADDVWSARGQFEDLELDEADFDEPLGQRDADAAAEPDDAEDDETTDPADDDPFAGLFPDATCQHQERSLQDRPASRGGSSRAWTSEPEPGPSEPLPAVDPGADAQRPRDEAPPKTGTDALVLEVRRSTSPAPESELPSLAPESEFAVAARPSASAATGGELDLPLVNAPEGRLPFVADGRLASETPDSVLRSETPEVELISVAPESELRALARTSALARETRGAEPTTLTPESELPSAGPQSGRVLVAMEVELPLLGAHIPAGAAGPASRDDPSSPVLRPDPESPATGELEARFEEAPTAVRARNTGLLEPDPPCGGTLRLSAESAQVGAFVQQSADGSDGLGAEVFELRYEVDRRECELQDLQAQQSRLQHALLEEREARLATERLNAELSDGVAELKLQVSNLERSMRGAQADKVRVTQRANEHQQRAERLRGELAVTKDTLAELREDHERALANLCCDRDAALAQATYELERAQAEAHAYKTQASRLQAREVQAQKSQAEDHLAELKAESARQLAAREQELREEAQAALRTAAEGHHRAVLALQTEAGSEIAALRQQLSATEFEKLDLEGALKEVREALEAERAQRLEVRREDHASLQRVKAALAAAQTDLEEIQSRKG